MARDKMCTCKVKSVRARVLLDVIQEVPTGHPFRDKLERGGDTEEGDNVFMLQAFPYHSLPTECLYLTSGMINGEVTASEVYLLRTILGGEPNALNANP